MFPVMRVTIARAACPASLGPGSCSTRKPRLPANPGTLIDSGVGVGWGAGIGANILYKQTTGTWPCLLPLQSTYWSKLALYL